MNEYSDKQRENPYVGAKFKRKWQNFCITCIWACGHVTFTSPVVIRYRFYEKNHRRDLDNISGFAHKVINDALVEARTIKDDGWKHIRGYTDEFYCDPKHPRIEITVKEVEE